MFEHVEARCGDGIVSNLPPMHPNFEECDDGNQVATDPCTNRCRVARCGDGVVGPNEECDDGNDRDGDGCESDCRLCVPAPEGDL